MSVEAKPIFDVSRETLERLRLLESLLVKWNPAINLVAKSTVEQAWSRHIVDSMQIYDLAAFDHWVDLGSGGGFPGLVIAAIAEEMAPKAKVTLVEIDLRKATFLRQAVQAMGLKAEIRAERIENIPPMNADILSARALAPLGALCAFADRHLAKTGTAIFPKGANWQSEVADARKLWRFDFVAKPSVTDPAAVVLVMKAFTHV